MKRVVVTGLGLLTSIGNNKEETWKNLISCKSGIKKINHFETDEYNDGQIYIGSDRLTFSAEEDDIAIFAKGKVHIKADRVQIKNAMGGMELGAKQIITDAKSKVDVNKSFNSVLLIMFFFSNFLRSLMILFEPYDNDAW